MAISVLKFSDAQAGQSFSRWVDEFVYAVGAFFDFDTVSLPKPDVLVLSLICLPPHLNSMRTGTSFRRAAGEFWSSAVVDHDPFVTADVGQRIAAIRDGMSKAIQQIPTSRLPEALKVRCLAAIDAAAVHLSREPGHHPR